MSRDPYKGAPAGAPGLIREGMFDRLLRRLVRPRVELPLERPEVTTMGDMELRWAPLRVKYATYEADINALKVIVSGARVALPATAKDIASQTVQITAPAAVATYWIYLDSALGTLAFSTTQPPAGNIEIAAITTPSAWPAVPTNWAKYTPQPDFNSLHGLTSKATGDCVVTLSDRTAYRWNGSAWDVLLRVVDKRPAFSVPPAATGGSGFRTATVIVAAVDSSALSKAGADYVCTGTNDHITINTAIDALPAGGGKVVLLEGTYQCASLMKLRDNMTIEGMGKSTVIKGPSPTAVSITWFSNRSADATVVYGSQNIHVRDMRFDGNNAGTTATTTNTYSAIKIAGNGVAGTYNNTNISVTGCLFYDLGQGSRPMDIQQTRRFLVKECVVDRCGSFGRCLQSADGVVDSCHGNGYDTYTAAGYYGTGITVDTSHRITIEKCTALYKNPVNVVGSSSQMRFIGNYFESSNIAIHIGSGCSKNVISANRVFTQGAKVPAAIQVDAPDTVVSDNVVECPLGDDSWQDILIFRTSSATIVGNVVRGGGAGIAVTDSSGCTVTGNAVTQACAAGILVGTTTSAKDNTISNNVVWDIGTAAVAGAAGIRVDGGVGSAILGNTIRRAANQSYGIEIRLNSASHFVNGNDCFQGGNTNGIFDLGTGTVIGYNRNNDGTFSTTPN